MTLTLTYCTIIHCHTRELKHSVLSDLGGGASLAASATASGRIQFKIAISAAFHCVREHCLAYFNNVCIPVAGVSGRAHLRSAERHDMLVLRQEHSLVDGVSMLQPQPSGTHFHNIFAHHSSVVDSLGLGWKPISSHRPTDTSENFCWRAYSLHLHFTLYYSTAIRLQFIRSTTIRRLHYHRRPSCARRAGA